MRFHAVLVLDLGFVFLALVLLAERLRGKDSDVRRAALILCTTLAVVGVALLGADLTGIIRLPRPHDAPPPVTLPATSAAPLAAEAPVITPKVEQKNLQEAGEHHREALERFEHKP